MSVTEPPVAVTQRPTRPGTVGRVLRRPLGAAALIYLALLIVAVIAAPLLVPAGPLSQDLNHVFAGPTAPHPLGTDSLGRDLLSRVLYGGRVSLVGVSEAVAVVLLVGVPVGVVAGYLGGWLDAVVMRVTDVVLAIPVIIMLLVVLATFGQGETTAMVTLGLLAAPSMIRVVRGAALAVRPELFITAARVSGLTTPQILRRHVLPRVAGPVIVQASLFAGVALITESGLAFLGLGVQEPQPTWGGMIAAASNVVNAHPWMLVPPGLAIGLTALACGLLGDAVRDAIGAQTAPQPRRRRGPAVPASPRPDADGSALLTVSGLSAVLAGAGGAPPVLQDVSFTVARGETVGLVGESGCGKTLTARAILGLLPAVAEVSAGSIRFDGTELLGLAPVRARALCGSQIGFISQEPIASLDPNARVGSQVAEVIRRHHGVSRAQARARTLALLERVKLDDPADVARLYPHELSGGMAQRVSIAAALAGEPRLLIADEPTTALDVTVQAEILRLLSDIQADTGLAILLVTHDWGVVADSCDRALVMYAGQVVETTTVSRMYDQPLHPYTDGLLHSNPASAPPGERLPAIAGTVPPPGSWPPGCHFHPRCPLATPECAAAPIALEHPEPGRQTRCIHHEQLVVHS